MPAVATTERPRPAERRAFTISEFAEAYRLSVWNLYALWRRGEGPARFRVGSRWLISDEAAEKWRSELESMAASRADATK